MREYRITPDVLKKYVHKSLIEVFGDVNYISYFDHNENFIGTTDLEHIERIVICHLVGPISFAFPLKNGETVKMSFACDFYDDKQIHMLIRKSLENTINAIAENEKEFKDEE